MSLVADYSTLEEYLESQRSLRSPTLQRSAPNFDSIITPPPLVDAPEDFEAEVNEGTPEEDQSPLYHNSGRRPKPSLYDSLLVRALGPDYPTEIADLAGTELPVDNPDIPFEDRRPGSLHEQSPMIEVASHQDVSITSNQPAFTQQALTASRRASEKLNDAISVPRPSTSIEEQSCVYHDAAVSHPEYSIAGHRAGKSISISIKSLTRDHQFDNLRVSHLGIQTSPVNKKLDTQPPSRPTLPSLRITNRPSTLPPLQSDSLTNSPSLARFAITPADGHPSQVLPRLQHQQSPVSIAGQSPEFRQSLPSLETALKSATDSNGTPYIDASPSLTRPSPTQHSQYALSPATYAHHKTNSSVSSPPRFSSNPASWRTLSRDSSNSSSDFASGPGSNSASTPVTRPSPSRSISTPHSQYPGSEHDSNPDSDYTMMGGAERSDYNAQLSVNTGLGYSCSFQGCTAAPFQTQYLLNSHTNVHSNQRPHFCPVEECPRGPGGQGFKRKNEMIRHGLVHQSPGYVCPFCPDQQHKYPRPDNLQRHVRVHHVDRDRDDPLLRDVLAQRPEGGNRGRRRRLGG